MHEALRALNQIVADRVVEKYAIGGAVGAAFYIEATQTADVDVVVYLQPGPSGLVTLEPIFDALIRLGGIGEDGYIRFGEWPIQILSDATPLIAEAIEEAIDVPFDGIPTRVSTVEARRELDMKSESKRSLNASAKNLLRTDLRAKTWVQKVQAMARMNSMTKTARASMKRRLPKP